jgi:hypothetical protein
VDPEKVSLLVGAEVRSFDPEAKVQQRVIIQICLDNNDVIPQLIKMH